MTPDREGAARSALPEMLAVAAVVGACGVAVLALRGGCGAHATAETCDAILDRYVEARLRQLDPRPAASTVASSRAATLREAAGSKRFARCSETLREEAARCALDAGDADAIERCLQ